MKHSLMMVHHLKQAIEWLITENYPELLDDDLPDAMQDEDKIKEAVHQIISYLEEEYDIN